LGLLYSSKTVLLKLDNKKLIKPCMGLNMCGNHYHLRSFWNLSLQCTPYESLLRLISPTLKNRPKWRIQNRFEHSYFISTLLDDSQCSDFWKLHTRKCPRYQRQKEDPIVFLEVKDTFKDLNHLTRFCAQNLKDFWYFKDLLLDFSVENLIAIDIKDNALNFWFFPIIETQEVEDTN